MKMTKDMFQKTLTLISEDPDIFSDFFYDSVMTKSEEFHETFRNTNMKLQKEELINAFVTIFAKLEKPEKLARFLHDLGARHVAYEVREEDYPLIKDALMETLEYLHNE